MSIFTQNNGKFRVQVRRKGVPKLDKVFDTLDEALAAEKEVLSLGVKAGLTLKEAVELFQGSSNWQAYATNTRIAYEGNLRPTVAALGIKTLTELEQYPMLVQLHFDKRAQRARAEKLRLEIAALGAVVRWCVKRGYIRTYFIRDVTRPRGNKRTRRVARVDAENLFNAESEVEPFLARHARFQLALLHLGCRCGELATARREAFDPASKTLWVTGKTGPRLLHCSGTALLALVEQAALDERPYLWSGKGGKPYNPQHGVRILKKHKVVSPTHHNHANRREFISRGLEAGVPINTLKKQTGHASVQALEAYDCSATGTAAQREQLEMIEVQLLENLYAPATDSVQRKAPDTARTAQDEANDAVDEDIQRLLKALAQH